MALPPSPVLTAKLKEGIKDAIVFLRMLEGSKLSAIVERKRKELLEQLLGLIGDSIREEPPSYEPKDSKSTTTSSGETVAKATRPLSADPPDKRVTPPTSPPEKPVAKQSENVATLDKKQPERTTLLQPEKSATLDKKQPERTTSLQPEKSATLDKKQPEKTPTLDRKQPVTTTQSEAGPHENAEHLATPATTAGGKTASPLLGKKNKKPVETGKDDVTASSKGASQIPKTIPTTATPEPQEPAETQTPEPENFESTPDSPSAKVKKPKNVFGGVKNIFGSRKRDRDSIMPSEATGEAAPTSAIDESALCQDYSNPIESLKAQEVLQSQECLGKLSGHLEKQMKGGMFGGNWVKQLVVLKEDSILIDSKSIPLLGCTVKEKGTTGFKLTLPDSNHVMLRAETEEVRKQWVAAVNEVITACTPVQEAVAIEEEKDGALKEDKRSSVIPQISVTSENSEEGGGGGEPLYKNVSIKGSEECLKKHAVEMPDQRVATMKGIVNHKVWLGLEKRWALLTSEPCLYLSQSESSTESLARLPLEQGFFEHKKDKKGSGRLSSFVVKSGKNKETFSVAQGEMPEWQSALEVALGISSADLELASSDEDAPEPEENYEDVGNSAPPPIPGGPRPTRVSVASSEPENYSEDIYEECDDTPRGSALSEVAPSLPPPRGPQKEPTSAPSPVLPPRKETNSSPSPTPAKVPQKDKEPAPAKSSSASMSGIPARPQPPPTVTTANKKPADKPAKGPPPKPIPISEDDEVYDDIAQDPQEEDDSYYEDTAAASPPQQDDEYVDVEHGEQGEEGEEEYVDVDLKPEPPNAARRTSSVKTQPPPLPTAPQPPAPHRSPAPNPKVTPSAVKNKVSSLSTMFESSKKKEGCSGQVSYKNPAKGSNYKEEWVVLEGSTPQQAVLNMQKTATDKKPYTQLFLHDADLNIGTGEFEGGAFTFGITKNGNHHLFSVKTQEELDKWMLAMRPLVKRVVLTDAKYIYEVKEDYTPSDSGDNLTLKKGMFVQVLKDKSPTVWIGQCGNYHDIYAGPIGAFPSSKVVPVSSDDVYM